MAYIFNTVYLVVCARIHAFRSRLRVLGLGPFGQACDNIDSGLPHHLIHVPENGLNCLTPS